MWQVRTRRIAKERKQKNLPVFFNDDLVLLIVMRMDSHYAESTATAK